MKFESDYIEKLAKIIADNGLTDFAGRRRTGNYNQKRFTGS